MSTKLDISIVIPVYNRLDELRMTLQSLVDQTLAKEKFEVIVSDDGSSDDIQSVLRDFPDIQIVYCHQPNNGFRVAAARNMGATHASGRIIIYNDNGILLKSNNLEKHRIAHHIGDSKHVVLGNMYGTSYQCDQDKIRGMLNNNSVDASIAIMKSDSDMRDGRSEYFRQFGQDIYNWYIPWLALWGGHFSVNASFVKSNHINWNESFTSWGGEDNEYGIQLCDMGGRLSFHNEIEVVHFPTLNRANLDITSQNFTENHDRTKQYILSIHPTPAVQDWVMIGSYANDYKKRLAFRNKLNKD